MRRTSLGPRIGSRQGFTLIELIIVIAIMGAMITIASISMSDYILRSRLQEAARNVDGDLAVIRNTARVQQQRNIVVQFTSTGYFVFHDGDGNLVSDPTDTSILQRNFTGGVQLAVTSTNQNAVAPFTTVEYTALGTLDPEWNRLITVSMSSLPMRKYQVWLYSTGVTRVERSEDGGVTWSTRAW